MNDLADATIGPRPKDAATRATFVSYDERDADEVDEFLDTHRGALGAIRSVGVTSTDALAGYADDASIIQEIARRYIGSADLALVLVGDRTWMRRFIDWEVAASASVGCPVLAVPLGATQPAVPARVRLLAEERRAIVAAHAPVSTAELRNWIVAATSYATSSHSSLRAMRTPLMRRDVSGTQR